MGFERSFLGLGLHAVHQVQVRAHDGGERVSTDQRATEQQHQQEELGTPELTLGSPEKHSQERTEIKILI